MWPFGSDLAVDGATCTASRPVQLVWEKFHSAKRLLQADDRCDADKA